MKVYVKYITGGVLADDGRDDCRIEGICRIPNCSRTPSDRELCSCLDDEG